MQSFVTKEETAPAHWTVAIINGDNSHMSEAEDKALDKWAASLELDGFELMHITIADDAEPYFGVWLQDWGQPEVKAGDLLDYTVVYRKLD